MKELRRQNAYINDMGLREVDAHIINVRAIEPEAQVDSSYAARPTRPGQTPLKRLRRSKKIQVQFMIRELYDLASRASILDAVNAWARDGVLMISTRPDQMAQVIVTKYANPADIRDYTGAYAVEFEACGVPYWQDANATQLSLSGSSGSGSLVIPGNVETVLDAVITPTGGALNTLSLTATSADGVASAFSFSSLGVAKDTPMVISHDARGILRIVAGSSSLMGKRSAASADELFVRPGLATVAFEANTACGVTITARGWYR